MTYILKKTNGAVLTSISNGSIDQTTDLIFVGKNYAGYGKAVNEDLLKLLENFSSGVAPTKPIMGQLWYDSAAKRLKNYNGSRFKGLANTEVATNAPVSSTMNTGDFWWDSNDQVLKVFNGSDFTLIGPTLSSVGSYFKFDVVQDNSSILHTVVEHTIPDSVGGIAIVAVVSNDDFSPSTNIDPVGIYDSTFQKIRKGVTLQGTDLNGQSSLDGADGTYLFWGTASDSLKLKGASSAVDASADTIALRDISGDLTANIFHGVATAAQYADLAERYHADANYEVGTVLIIGGLNEVTITSEHANIAVAGIVSQKPAFMMNSEAGTDETHPYIALKGRVPCKIIGPVKKGDSLVTSIRAGYATVYNKLTDNANAIIGKALENFEGSFGVIEVKV